MNRVEQHYNQQVDNEWERLARHRTEFAVTLRALSDHLPPPPAAILDIGGGPGRYAIELARSGYSVILVDLSQKSLDYAKKMAKKAQVELAYYLHANALDLNSILPARFDAALLMGPLYHLLAEDQRRQAIGEAKRLLKWGGLIFASFITRFAPFRQAAGEKPEWLSQNRAYAFDLLESGVHERGEAFPDAYFAHPDEIIPLMERSGFRTIRLIGCEGVVAGHEEMVNKLEGKAWQDWVELNYRLGQETSLYGASDHLLYIGEKPDL